MSNWTRASDVDLGKLPRPLPKIADPFREKEHPSIVVWVCDTSTNGRICVEALGGARTWMSLEDFWARYQSARR